MDRGATEGLIEALCQGAVVVAQEHVSEQRLPEAPGAQENSCLAVRILLQEMNEPCLVSKWQRHSPPRWKYCY